MKEKGIEKKRFIYSLIYPLIFVAVLWLVKLIEIEFDLELYKFGLYPLKVKGLLGIVTSPFIHSDYAHLIANSIPLLVLGTGLFYFYKDIAVKVFLLGLFMCNFWLWFGAREAYHIGASGVVYSLASFLFFSGVARKDIRLMAISLIVVFLYGSMVWGIFPFFDHVSWESHLLGGVAGLILAFFYRSDGPKKKVYSWEFEDDDDDDDEDGYWNINYEFDEELLDKNK